MSSPASESVASTVPAAVWFSAASNAASELNAGAALASVAPLPASDHEPVPSSLVARTCTWWEVFSDRPDSVAVVAVPV